MTDSELIGRILAGEDRLFGELVNRYTGCVWAICASHIFSPTDCEDVVQDTFVQCYLRLNTLRRPAAFGRWLSQVARRRCLQWLRTTSRRRAAMTRYEEHVENAHDATSAEDSLAREDVQRTVYALVQTLPPKTREALFLCYSEGYSATQAAEILGTTPDAVAKRLRYGRTLLEKKIAGELEPALRARKHREPLAGAVVAAIPFGNAPWLGAAGAAAASKLGTMGGIAVMTKKTFLVVGAVLALVVLTYSLAHRPDSPLKEKPQPAATEPAALPEPEPKALAETVAPHTPLAAQPPEAVAAIPQRDEEDQAVPEVEAEPERPASIAGYVRDSDGYALANAAICLEVGRGNDQNDVAGTYRTQTGTDGLYEIVDIDTFGRAMAFASAPGCLMQRTHLRLAQGLQQDDVNFTLPKVAFWVAGRVVSEARSPIPGASVDVMYYGYSEAGLAQTAETGGTTGNISNSKQVFAVTDDQGRFEIGIPAPGLCDFRVTKGGFGPGFFPKVATGTVDALFVLRGGGTIAGNVTNAQGEPVAAAAVKVTGEALPGGLTPSAVRIQALPSTTVTVDTDPSGNYLAEGLGEDYVYTVTASDPAPEKIPQLPEEQGVRYIANMMREFDGFDPSRGAEKKGVRVTAGQTTSGVDLVFGSPLAATIYGTVTDRTTGAPVCPIAVTASVADPASEGEVQLRASAVTNLDGSYTIRTRDITETLRFRVQYRFMTEGGSSWPQPEDDVALLDLGPGDEEELDFEVDAPVVVPVRFVNQDGVPVEGIGAGLRRAERGSGGCGGSLISDPEGRVAFHGIPPFVSLRALAWLRGSWTEVGVSEPFMGEPGETVPEVIVVCPTRGGVEGVVLAGDGRPVSNTEIACYVVLPGGTLMEGRLEGTTDADGAFCFLQALPAGVYPRVLVGYGDISADDISVGVVDNVEVLADGVTDLGRVATTPVAVAEGMAMLGVAE